MKKRHVGQVSFNLENAYESGLHQHAAKDEHGDFSNYVKRLIHRDKERSNTLLTSSVYSAAPVREDDGDAADGFL